MTITESVDIRFDCPQCGQPFVVEPSGAGMETSCPICESKVIVPQMGALDRRNYGRTSRHEFADPDAAAMREELIDGSLRTGRIERELDEAHAEIAALRQQLKAPGGVPTHAEIKSFQADRAQLKAELAATRQRLSNTEGQLAESRARAADLQTGLALANEEIATTLGAAEERATALESQRQQLALDLDVTHEKIRAFETELATRDREREEAHARTTVLDEQLARAKGEISALQDESALYRRNFDEAQAKLAEGARVQLELAETVDELRTTQGKLQAAEEGCKSLSICCEELRKETESLRSDLQASANGRELMELRTQFKAEQEEHGLASRKLKQAEKEVHRLTAAESQLRTELGDARRSHADAERRAEAGSESKLSKDNSVLRGIIERQNDELAQRLHDLNGLRRAQLWLRLTYAIFAVGLLGVVAFAIHVIPLIFK